MSTPAGPGRYQRPSASPAERLRFVLLVVAVLVVLLAVFGIIRITQQNNAEQRYQECLDNADAQAAPDPTAPEPADMCQPPG